MKLVSTKKDLLDPVFRLYSYHTASIETDTDLIDLTNTGWEYYNSLLLHESENVIVDIINMSPEEYYKACSGTVMSSSAESLKKQRSNGWTTIVGLKKVLKEYKVKLCMPLIDYADKRQDGLHRMYIIGEIYGWDFKVPVMIVKPKQE